MRTPSPLFLVLALTAISASPARAQVSEEGQYVQLHDMEMHYEVRGKGEPLLLLHGFGGCGGNWDEFVAPLAEHYRLIIPDLRGHGRSTNPAGTFTHRQAAYDVYALLDSLGIETFASMGISTGGMTLFHMATQQPERVGAIVPIGATTYFPEQARAIMRTISPETLSTEEREFFLQCASRGDGQVDEIVTQFRGFKDSYDDMTFTPPQLATISARALIIHGDRDEFFPVDIPIQMYRSIPDAALWIVPDGGHVPIYDPIVPFTEVVLRFLAGVVEGGR